MEVILSIALAAAVIVALWRIVPRAGLSPWWALVVLIPVLGLPALLLYMAFTPWPGDGPQDG
ncbi:MAG: hypothetical protein AAF371_18525 [Pseudomonadota bacterium]